MADAAQKKAGRPRKSEGPRLPHMEVDLLLVEGEELVGADGRASRRFPSLRELGQRFGVAHSLIAQFAKQHDCQGRRQRFLAGEPVQRIVLPRASPGGLEPQAEEAQPTPVQSPQPREESPPAPGKASAGSETHRLPMELVQSAMVRETPQPLAEPPQSAAESATPHREGKAKQPRSARETQPTPAAPRRPRGRPYKGDAPRVPYEELDKLLVFGEVVALPDGTTTTVHPSRRQLAERYGVSTSLIASYSRSHNCKRRREEAKARITARTDQKLVELRASSIAVSKDDAIRMIDGYLVNFERALGEGRVRFDDPTDFNTMVRLKEYVLGGADSRQEIHASLSLEDLQTRHARMMREVREATPSEQGIIDARPLSSSASTAESGVQFPEARSVSRAVRSLPEARSVSSQERSLSEARSVSRDACSVSPEARSISGEHFSPGRAEKALPPELEEADDETSRVGGVAEDEP